MSNTKDICRAILRMSWAEYESFLNSIVTASGTRIDRKKLAQNIYDWAVQSGGLTSDEAVSELKAGFSRFQHPNGFQPMAVTLGEAVPRPLTPSPQLASYWAESLLQQQDPPPAADNGGFS